MVEPTTEDKSAFEDDAAVAEAVAADVDMNEVKEEEKPQGQTISSMVD